MSRHRIKDVDYDDDDFYDDDDDDITADPEEQEFLQQCTTAVLQQLNVGQPSVTATKEEVQDALWHYYNDIEKSVNYLRGTFNFRRYSASHNVPTRVSAFKCLLLNSANRSSACRKEREGGYEAAEIEDSTR